jgi:hypothetical protein
MNLHKSLTVLIIVLMTKTNIFAQCLSNINHWESCVVENQTWKYFTPSADIPGWQLTTFNDASWPSGQGGMGFGDGDDLTIIPTTAVCVYMRKTFNIIDTSVINSVLFAMDYDDGFVAYLNGVEIARANMVGTPSWNTLASASHEAQLYQNFQPLIFSLTQNTINTLLKNGTNVLCIETHNNTIASTDLTSRPALVLGLTNATINYLPTPPWFYAPTNLYTNLPIVTINTLNQTIMDDPRIVCEMGIINNGIGQMNCIDDPYNNYNGKISIEYRGSSSQMFPKKQYGFSTLNNLGIDSSASLLNMPSESDWVLLNPYTDKTFMRDVLIHTLAREMNWYSSRTEFVELMIDGQYQGVYVLMEKIKRDDERVDIAKLTNTANNGDSVTGGYICKVDWSTGNSGGFWSSFLGLNFQNHEPKWNEITTQQQIYLENHINTFETALSGPNSTNANIGYRKFLNVFSFVDYFLMQEFSNNLDGYRASNYIHKDRNSRCGRITIGPFWDFNITLGNANLCNGNSKIGWQYIDGCPGGTSAWFTYLLQDQWFKNLMNCRYNELRQTIFSVNSINAHIDTFRNHLLQAYVRDSAKWQTIGTYVWPNNWIPNTWQGEIDSMKNWINGRINWLDANMYPSTQPCNSTLNVSLVIDEINFHSDSTTDAGDWIELYNYGNTNIDLSNAMILDGDQYEKYCVIPNGTTLAAGARLVIYSDSIAFTTRFPSVTNKIGPLCFKLSNSGQKIVIKDKDNKLIYNVNYFDTWECSTDGNGRTLQLTTPTANPNTFSSWYAGCMGGSPGVAYTPCNELLIYSEINYASAATADAGDWIELYNKNTVPINLNGWSIRDGSDNNVFTFTTSYNLLPLNYLVLFNDAAKFSARFPTVSNKIGPIGFGFNSTSDVIRLYDNSGKLNYSVCYKSTTPWPTVPNGGGKTLENGQYNGNHNAATSWFAGCPEGSPGKVYNPVCWPTSITEQQSENTISVYPNPAHDILHYYANEKIIMIKLIDALGKSVIAQQNDNNTIEITSLAAGFYTVEFLGNNNSRYFVKFVKH